MDIRKAAPEDAARIIAYIQRLLEEMESNMELSEGEFNIPVADEQAILEKYNRSENSLFILAECDRRIVGLLHCKGSERRKIRHSVTLGISVDKEFRNAGIGSQLMAYAIEWAKGTGIVKRMELSVFETNANAIHLYQKKGFTIEGKKRRAIFRDGRYIDEYIMALLL
jgi:RimJ/RimL family protein N-acetyltransferase